MVTLTFSDYSPNSWFEVTVRNRTTGEIYNQDGFGTAKGLHVYTTGTIKVMKTDDLLIEFSGNLITASAGIWVKPSGNIDPNQTMNFTECKYWETPPRNYLVMPTATSNANVGTLTKYRIKSHTLKESTFFNVLVKMHPFLTIQLRDW